MFNTFACPDLELFFAAFKMLVCSILLCLFGLSHPEPYPVTIHTGTHAYTDTHAHTYTHSSVLLLPYRFVSDYSFAA